MHNSPSQIGVFDVCKALRYAQGDGFSTTFSIAIPTDLRWTARVAKMFWGRSHDYRTAIMPTRGGYAAIIVYPNTGFWHGRALLNTSGQAIFDTPEEAQELLDWRVGYLNDGHDCISSSTIAAMHKAKAREFAFSFEHYAKQGVLYEPDAWKAGGSVRYLDGTIRRDEERPDLYERYKRGEFPNLSERPRAGDLP